MRVTLARIRENANLTQTQLSQSAKISQGYYSDIEGGVRCPSPGVALRIARVLGIGEQDIYGVFYAPQVTAIRGGGACSEQKGAAI
jgi:transcriptional regulator with XRE-family HTH domain